MRTVPQYEPAPPFARLTWVLLTPLGLACKRASQLLEEWGYRLVRCPHCGRSRFYGRACVIGRDP